jgi:hypothetical protein
MGGRGWLITGASLTLLCAIGAAQETAPGESLPLDAIIPSMEKAQAAVRTQVSYQVIREYRLFGAKESKANSEVVAEVNFKPPSSKGYRIQSWSGSNRGEQVVRRVLDHEVQATSKDNKDSSVITRDNYIFSYIGEAALDGQTCYLVGLKPKRKQKDLISGEMWIDERSFLIRQIEGEIENTPSWWLKKVRVKLVFADLEGIWVQTSMKAVADVRLIGTHTLTSRVLDYRKADEVAAAPFPAGSGVRKTEFAKPMRVREKAVR